MVTQETHTFSAETPSSISSPLPPSNAVLKITIAICNASMPPAHPQSHRGGARTRTRRRRGGAAASGAGRRRRARPCVHPVHCAMQPSLPASAARNSTLRGVKRHHQVPGVYWEYTVEMQEKSRDSRWSEGCSLQFSVRFPYGTPNPASQNESTKCQSRMRIFLPTLILRHSGTSLR